MNVKRMLICALGVFLITSSGALAIQDDIAIGTDTAGGTILIYKGALGYGSRLHSPTSYLIGTPIERVRYQSDGDLVFVTGATVKLCNGSNALSIQNTYTTPGGVAINDMVVRPNGDVVITYGDATSSTLALLNDTSLTLADSMTRDGTGPDQFKGEKYMNELAVQPDGDILYGQSMGLPGTGMGAAGSIQGARFCCIDSSNLNNQLWSVQTGAYVYALSTQSDGDVAAFQETPGCGTGGNIGLVNANGVGITGNFVAGLWVDMATQNDDDLVVVGDTGVGHIIIYDGTGPYYPGCTGSGKGWKSSAGSHDGDISIGARAVAVQSDDDIVVTYRDTYSPTHQKLTSDATELGIWRDDRLGSGNDMLGTIWLVTSVTPGGTITSNVAVDPVAGTEATNLFPNARFDVLADTRYFFKGYYTSEHPGKALVVGQWLDKDGKPGLWFELKLPDTQGDWIPFFKEVRSPINATQLEIVVKEEWHDGSVLFDDFSLRKGSIPDYAAELSLPPLKPGQLRFPIVPGLGGPIGNEWEAECAMANFSVGGYQAKYGLLRRIPANEAFTWSDAELIKINRDPGVYDFVGHDEPGPSQYPGLAEQNKRFKRLAPAKPFVVNLPPTYANPSYESYRNDVRLFIETVKPSFFTYDHYALNGTPYRGSFYPNFEIARQEALRADIHFGFFGASVGGGGVGWSPDEAQLRWQAYSALAYGAQSLLWFTYNTPVPGNWHDAVIQRDGSRTRHYAMLRRLNGEVLALGDTLLRLKSTGVFHTTPLPALTRDISKSKLMASVSAGRWVLGEFVDDSSRPYLMLVNRDFTKEQQAVITFYGKVENLVEISKTDGAKVPVKSFDPRTHSITLKVPAGDGRLFLLE